MSRSQASSWVRCSFEHEEVERLRAGFVAARDGRFADRVIDPARASVLIARRATSDRRFAERLARFDLDRDGRLSSFEQRRFAASSRVQMRRLRSGLDVNNDGDVCPVEFEDGTGIPFETAAARTARHDAGAGCDRLWQQLAFVGAFDRDDDGRLDVAERRELRSVTGEGADAVSDQASEKSQPAM